MLADLVKAGTLPPVEQRLPDSPLVVKPLDSIGTYGGQWHTGTIERNGNDLLRNIGYEQLLRYSPDYKIVMMNMAESVKASEDGTEYTFTLRKGIKWSDGNPFTTEDVQFWYDDVIMNKDITPTRPKPLYVITTVDDLTFKWTWPTPNGLFLKDFTRVHIERACMHQKKYLMQFHTKYNTTNLDELTKKYSQDTWAALFLFMRECYNNPDVPTMWPWKLQTAFGRNTRVTAKRNPYYIKVDPEGNQLPYIDTYAQELATDNEVLVLKALNGELDWQEQWINAPKNKSIFYDNQDKGKFHLFDIDADHGQYSEYHVQYELHRPGDRKRLPVIKISGLASPMRSTARRSSTSYSSARVSLLKPLPGPNRNIITSDWRPSTSNTTSTKPMLLWIRPTRRRIRRVSAWVRTANGFRSSSKSTSGRTTYIDSLELIKKTVAKAGIEINVKTMDRALWEQRVRGTDFAFQASAHIFGGGSGDAVILDPRYWFPQNTGSSFWAKAWAWYYVDPKNALAEEPPDPIKKQMDLYNQIRATSDDQKQQDLLKQILDIQADEFPVIGICYDGNFYGISVDKLKNTAKVLPSSYDYPTPAPTNPATWYFA